jgi:hypothetical protein
MSVETFYYNCYNNMYHNIIYLLSQILYRNLIHSSKKNGPAFQLFSKYIIKQMPWVFKTPCVINYNKVIQKRTFWLCNLCHLWNFIWKSKGLHIYIFSNLYEYIYIRLIIYSYFYLFKYSTNKYHRKLCIYTHRIWMLDMN